jgi:hypothetical protein
VGDASHYVVSIGWWGCEFPSLTHYLLDTGATGMIFIIYVCSYRYSEINQFLLKESHVGQIFVDCRARVLNDGSHAC